MKHIMISIKPEYVDAIIKGYKTLEVRKTHPNEACIVEIYETKSKWLKPYYNSITGKTHYIECFGRGKVVAQWFLEQVYTLERDLNDWLPKSRYDITKYQLEQTTLSEEKLWSYGQGKTLYAWEIFDLKTYKTPKSISDFGLKRPPQSWQYIKEQRDED